MDLTRGQVFDSKLAFKTCTSLVTDKYNYAQHSRLFFLYYFILPCLSLVFEISFFLLYY